ncbi:MAG: TIGR03086 family metal-binding protein [Nocardioides sp.]
METLTLYHRCLDEWLGRLDGVGTADWQRPTPCRDWDVRQLVNHLVGEDLWTVPLMAGARLEDVGDRLDGDLLGDDAGAAARASAKAARAAVDEHLPAGGGVNLSYGEERAEEYVMQLAADHLVHAWDLAAAVGGPRRLDDQAVTAVAAWFRDREILYRSAGLVAAHLANGEDPQARLLGGFGRDALWGANHACLAALSTAFGRGDIDAIMALMTDDCRFEATGPAPDGTPHEGAAAVRLQWEQLFGDTTEPLFEEEELFVSGDRGVLRWRFSWRNDEDTPGHVRGVDVFWFRDGLVAEKLSYVKG